MYNSMARPLEGGANAETKGDDAALVQAAQDNPAEFAHIYARYRHRVYAYLRVRLVNEEDAADMTQHVFLHAFDALPRYRPRAVPLGAWLFRIARNAATDVQRRHRPTIPWENVAYGPEPSSDQDVEAQVLQREAVDHLHALLYSLDPDTREVLLLRFAARLTAAEIGVVIGKSHAATRQRLARALHSLKERYDDESA